MIEYELEVSQQKDTIWIHCSDGSTVGRFGRMGVDIHNSLTEQLDGAPQCRICTHGKVNLEDWILFRNKALEFWNVFVPVDASDFKILTRWHLFCKLCCMLKHRGLEHVHKRKVSRPYKQLWTT